MTPVQLLIRFDKADLDKVIPSQDRLTDSQCVDLHSVFSKREKLFSGKLGHYDFKQMDLKLIPGAKPIHAKPYPFLKINTQFSERN
jgi:hypothetical protein